MADPSIAAAVSLPPKEAIAFLRQKTNQTTERWTDVWNEAHSRAFSVAGAATEAIVQDFRAAVAKAIEQGTTLEEFRRDFDDIVAKHGWVHTGSAGWRSQIIYETNLSTAYSAGRYAQMTEPDILEAFPYWRYQHNAAVHPRIQHLDWSGLVLRADDPWWGTHYPPNGWRCHCSVSAVSEGGLRRMGRTKPDTAPPVDLQKVRLKVGDGAYREVEVPRGIDPGFSYNPGQAWLEHADRPVVGQMPAKASVKPPPPVHADPAAVLAPPPVPATAPAMPVPKPAVSEPKPGPAPVTLKVRSTRKADELLTQRFTPWAQSLTDEERAALRDYKASGHRLMNKQVRGELNIPAVRAQVDALSAALGRARLPVALQVFRGISEAEFDALFAGKRVGDEVTYPNFLSASVDAPVAERFDAGAMLSIALRRGQRAAYVHPFPKVQSSEYEVLLQPGTRLRIAAIDGRAITLEAVGGRTRR